MTNRLPPNAEAAALALAAWIVLPVVLVVALGLAAWWAWGWFSRQTWWGDGE